MGLAVIVLTDPQVASGRGLCLHFGNTSLLHVRARETFDSTAELGPLRRVGAGGDRREQTPGCSEMLPLEAVALGQGLQQKGRTGGVDVLAGPGPSWQSVCETLSRSAIRAGVCQLGPVADQGWTKGTVIGQALFLGLVVRNFPSRCPLSSAIAIPHSSVPD